MTATLRGVWALMPTLAVLNLVVAAVIFAGSSVTGAAPWASVCLYPIPTLWLLIVLERVSAEVEGYGVARTAAVLRVAVRAVRPALTLGAPLTLVMLSALVAGALWLSEHAAVMLLPLLLGAATCSLAALCATAAARRAAVTGRKERPLRSLGQAVKEAVAEPGRSLAAAVCIVAIPVLVMAVNPGVLLAVPAPFALCAILATRTPASSDAH